MNFNEAHWRELGLWPHWVTRTQTQGPVPALADWEVLRQLTSNCKLCPLHQNRSQAVFGVGDKQASWFFVGEGPGAEEDQRGEPFVGAAGRLLDKMLLGLGLNREQDVYIANVVKCRPPQNRTPTESECATCLPYLHRQIALVRPKVIVALGKVAAHALLKTSGTLNALRLRQHFYGQIPLIVTWHPAYLLRTPSDKAGAWEDLCSARQIMVSQCTPHGDNAGKVPT